MKGIDPKWTMYLGLLVIVEQAIGHGTVSLTNLVPADWAPYITSWCNFLAFIGTTIMTYQGAVSSPVSGPAINTSIAPAAKAAIITAILLGSFAFPHEAMAQELGPVGTAIKKRIDTAGQQARSAVTGQPATATLDTIMDAIAKPFNDLADFIGSDADGAATLATQVPNLQDVNGKACWTKMQDAGAVFKAHPVPLTLKVMTDFEALRLLQMTANNLCSYAPCTVVFSDGANLATAVASAVGGALTSNAIPSLTQLCARIPQISPMLPTAVTGIAATTPVSTPVPSPTSAPK